jgi:transcriptional regulator with XRE-family HTH domain
MNSKTNFQEKLDNLVSEDKSNGQERARFRKQNKDWLLKSAEIALRVIDTLKDKKMTQAELAIQLETSPQNISKILKGQENLTLETIVKLERSLGIDLITIPKYIKQVEIKVPQFDFSSMVIPTTAFTYIEETVVVTKHYSKYQKEPAFIEPYRLTA